MPNLRADQSVRIDKKLNKMKNIIDEHDNYFFCKDPRQRLLEMKIQLDDILLDITMNE
jgi:hypothetical protein